MANFIELFKPKTQEPTLKQNRAVKIKDRLTNTRIPENAALQESPVEIIDQQKWMKQQMRSMGENDPALEAIGVSADYYSKLVSKCLDVTIAGGDMAARLGDVNTDLVKILNPKLSLSEMAKLSLDMCEAVVNGKKNKNIGVLSLEFPIIFDPWIQMIRSVNGRKKELLSNINRLDKGVEKSADALEKASKLLVNNTGANQAARKYDERLGIEEKLVAKRNRLSALGKDLVVALSLGDRQVSGIAARIADERTNLGSLAESAVASGDALSELMEESGKNTAAVLAVGTMTNIHRTLVVARGVNAFGAVALPILALEGLSNAITTASWWALYTEYRLIGEMSQRTDLSLTPSQVRKAIEANAAQSRADFSVIKNRLVNPINEGIGFSNGPFDIANK
jgi:hypothetical protein